MFGAGMPAATATRDRDFTSGSEGSLNANMGLPKVTDLRQDNWQDAYQYRRAVPDERNSRLQ